MTFAIHEGVWPVMITPWKEDNTPDFKALEALTNWYVEKGVATASSPSASRARCIIFRRRKSWTSRVAYRKPPRAGCRSSPPATPNAPRTEQYRQIEDMMKIPGIGAYVLVSNRMDIKNEGEGSLPEERGRRARRVPSRSRSAFMNARCRGSVPLTLDFIRDHAPRRPSRVHQGHLLRL